MSTSRDLVITSPITRAMYLYQYMVDMRREHSTERSYANRRAYGYALLDYATYTHKLAMITRANELLDDRLWED